MKNVDWLLWVMVVLVCSCQKKEGKSIQIIQQKKTELLATKLPVDTTFSIDGIIKERDSVISEVKIGKSVYRAVASTYSLNDSALVNLSIDTLADEIKVHKTRTHSFVYKVTLFKDGKLLYDKKYSRPEFYKYVKEDLVMSSAPLAPTLRGITKDGRVVYELAFAYPESDAGMMTFFTTDLSGSLLQMQYVSSSDGCYSNVQTSPNREYFLTCTTLFGPKGYTFTFEKPHMVHAEFLTDTSFVAIYDLVKQSGFKQVNGYREYFEQKDSTSNNLIIYHVSGIVLASYRYDGYIQELGYTVPAAVVPQKDKLFLLDDKKQHLLAISLSNPSKFEFIRLSTLEKLNSRLKKGQKFEYKLYGPGKRLFLYFLPTGMKYFESEEYADYED